MKRISDPISWKGISDYLQASRIIHLYGNSNTSGPRILCQGLTLELSLKHVALERRGSYTVTHDLERLAFVECNDISFTDSEKTDLSNHNKQYLLDGKFPFPSRYRPSTFRVFISIPQEKIESLVFKILSSSQDTKIADKVMNRS
jgi:hypothetical protein